MEKLDYYVNAEYCFDYKNFYSYIVNNTEYKTCAEIGVWRGHSISFLVRNILKRTNDIKIYAVDLWDLLGTANTPYEIKDGPVNDMEDNNIYDIYNSILEYYNIRKYIIDIKKDSILAANNFRNNYFDFVFLDANHNYENIKQDILAWNNKIRKGGMLAGHDYNQPSCGVKRAVDEIFQGKAQINGQVWSIIL